MHRHRNMSASEHLEGSSYISDIFSMVCAYDVTYLQEFWFKLFHFQALISI